MGKLLGYCGSPSGCTGLFINIGENHLYSEYKPNLHGVSYPAVTAQRSREAQSRLLYFCERWLCQIITIPKNKVEHYLVLVLARQNTNRTIEVNPHFYLQALCFVIILNYERANKEI